MSYFLAIFEWFYNNLLGGLFISSILPFAFYFYFLATTEVEEYIRKFKQLSPIFLALFVPLGFNIAAWFFFPPLEAGEITVLEAIAVAFTFSVATPVCITLVLFLSLVTTPKLRT
ncbi:MAG: hypothetical protein KIT08_02755 [Anaerolineales bacterium]|nr:MAG: hypothetical protein KIT08_02755 [Anaerolineales bacterium]